MSSGCSSKSHMDHTSLWHFQTSRVFVLVAASLVIALGSVATASTLPGFRKNIGQIRNQDGPTNPEAVYVHSSKGLNTVLRQSGFSYCSYVVDSVCLSNARDEHDDGEMRMMPHRKRVQSVIPRALFHRIDVQFVRPSPLLRIVQSGIIDSSVRYYYDGGRPNQQRGSLDQKDNANRVMTYDTVRYVNVWDGVDVVWKNSPHGKPEYEFHIKNIADLAKVRLRYDGASDVAVDEFSVSLRTSHGRIVDTIPHSYLLSGLGAEEVVVRYHVFPNGDVGFSYDGVFSDASLVVDPIPILQWSTYIGGWDFDTYYSVTTADDGAIFACGNTSSFRNIATTGSFQAEISGLDDAFISKFSRQGQRIWSTYYGTSKSDYTYDLSLLNGTSLVVCGSVSSMSLEVNTHIPSIITVLEVADTVDWWSSQTSMGFIARFDTSGAFEWSRIARPVLPLYQGGGAGNIAVYKNGDIAVVVSHMVLGFGVSWYSGDGVFLKQVGISQFYGSTSRTDVDRDNLVIVGSAYFDDPEITRMITSDAFQQQFGGGFRDGYLFIIDRDGRSVYGSFAGGAEKDEVWGVVILEDGGFVFCGYTESTSGIASGRFEFEELQGRRDGFVGYLSGSRVREWSRYIGGEGEEYLVSVASVPAGGSVLVGSTTSTTGIATPDASLGTHVGGEDVAVLLCSDEGTITYGSYWGGVGDDIPTASTFAGRTASLNVVGTTGSITGISTSTSFQRNYGGGNGDAFIASFSLVSSTSNATYDGLVRANNGSAVTQSRTTPFWVDSRCDAVRFFSVTGETFDLKTINGYVSLLSLPLGVYVVDGGISVPYRVVCIVD